MCAPAKVCTCSSVSVHMLNWKRAYVQLEACICSMKTTHNANKSVHMLKCSCAHAQLKACTGTIAHKARHHAGCSGEVYITQSKVNSNTKVYN